MLNKEYDIIITGAGCAGMQLMRAIIHHPLYKNQSILLIDDGKSIQQQKTWCFWHKPNGHVYETIISKQWNQLTLGFEGNLYTKSIAPYVYSYINSDDFFGLHLDLIQFHPQIQYREEQVLLTEKKEDGFYISTNTSAYKATHLFSCNWDQKQVFEKSKIALQQQFYGWMIETDKPVFNTTAATLMDFRTDQQQGVSFVYLLPFTAHTALVEFTSFTDKPYDVLYFEKKLSDYIHHTFNSSFRICKKEQALIPMTDYRFSRFTKEGAIAIGTAAGMVKPTTGYAFNRILRDSKLLANQLLSGKHIVQFESSRFRFYDQLLLQLIQKEPSTAKYILETLFKKVPYARILQFLDEDTHLWQETGIFSKLPKSAFIQTIPELWKQPRFKAIPVTQV